MKEASYLLDISHGSLRGSTVGTTFIMIETVCNDFFPLTEDQEKGRRVCSFVPVLNRMGDYWRQG